jgi:tetratricopeptide (TPR) repeat protein
MLCAGLGIKAHQYSDESMVVDISKMPILYVSIAIILLALAGGLGYFGSRAYAAEMYFKNSVNGIRANNGQAVYNNLVKAIQTNPYIERYHVQFGQVNLLLANNISKKKDLKDQDRQDIARFIQVAISEAKVPVQLNPNKVGYWNNLAVVYRNIINVAQGAESWTVASYRRAIVLDPNNPLLRLNLGGVYYSLKNYGEAESLFGQAAALKPDWANAFYNLSWAQFQGKKYDAAVANLENALKILDKKSPDYKKANENLEAFKAAAADTKKNAKTASESAGIQKGEELALPEKPNVQLSPALELPKGTGPENEIKVTPTPTASAPTTSVTPVISPAVIATPGA